jgi:peptidyl-prolyl cis-trans isomerase SurA
MGIVRRAAHEYAARMHFVTPPPLRAPHHTVLAVGLAAACLFAACRSSESAPAAPAVSADTWATVDGREITREQVERAFRRIGDSTQPLSEEEAMTAKLGLLDDLIMEDILVARAPALKVEVSEAEVDTAYNEARQNITEEAFQQELTKRNLTTADMRAGVRRDLLTKKVLDQEVVAKVTVTDQEITDFFNANRAQFNLPEDAFHLAQIVVTPVADPQLANRTGDDATTPQAATAKVSMLMERLKGGTAFSELARDYSEDPESAPRGGDLGLVPLSAIKQAAPALREATLQVPVGSARVVSNGGSHTIVFKVAQEPAGQRDLSTPNVRERITQGLRARKEQLLRAAYLAAARSDAEVVNYAARRIVEDVARPAAAPAGGGTQ